MSNLSTKILSYSPEQYIRFNTPYSTSPTNLGSGSTGSWSLTGTTPVLQSTSGPDGEGAWELRIAGNSSTNTTRFRIISSSNVGINSEITDKNFSLGFWFKLSDTIPTITSGASFVPIYQVQPLTVSFPQIRLSIANDSNKGKLGHSVTSTGGIVYSTNRIDDGQWHYVAVRFETTATDVYNGEIYLDGSLLSQFTQRTIASTATISTTFGINPDTATTENLGNLQISNYYITPFSVIDTTAISEIWTAGAPAVTTDISINETPATGSALQTEPTIAVIAGDHTEITTSIVVDATFPSSISVLGQSNIEIHPDTVPTATIEMINNVDVSTGSDLSFSSTEMIASALIVEPFVSIDPMTADALSGNHSVYVTPNYYSLVRASNPYAYFYDGLTSSVNGGYQSGTFTKGAQVTSSSDAGIPLNFIGNGKSWALSNISNADNYLDFTTASTTDSFAQHILNGECSVELYYKPTSVPSSTYGYWTLFNTEGLEIRTRSSSTSSSITGALEIVYKQGNTILSTHTSSYGLITTNNTHHIVATISEASVGNIQITGWVDGNVVISVTRSKSSWTVADKTARFGSSLGFNKSGGLGDGWFDELALYSQKLSNSEILSHYSFVQSQSPNKIISSDVLGSNASSGDHSFLIVSNINIQEDALTSSISIVNPTITTSKSIVINSDILTAFAEKLDGASSYGVSVSVQSLVSYAESQNAYRLNDTYYDYVQANIAPYRYVTFDGTDIYVDYGTDTDYSVVPFSIGGQIVNPDAGINGKSLKTAGNSYTTDGIILKESEYNDTWGTGLNNYHSSFWIQKSLDDTSTGLRVIWNLNGYADNQHVILYQYEDKLHLNFNNGSGTFIDQATLGTHDLFDGYRHFVAIAFDHTGANSYVRLFIDAIQVMEVNLGSYNGTTVNGTTYVPPNDELNNHPRMSVGCLITPFAFTSLPVVPTNTKIYVDEVIWAKSHLDINLATNLFNIMPVNGMRIISADPLTASVNITNAIITFGSGILSSSMSAQSDMLDVEIFTEFDLNINASALTANSEILEGLVFENMTIYSDIFVATAIFNDAGIAITIPGGPMIANAKLQTRYLFFSVMTNFGLRTYGLEKYQLSPWSKFLRAQDSTNKYPHGLYGTKEIR